MSAPSTGTPSLQFIERRILAIRQQRVMIDADLAELYGVTTKALNQAIKRNANRFPSDFVFQLSRKEKTEVVTICDHLNERSTLNNYLVLNKLTFCWL